MSKDSIFSNPPKVNYHEEAAPTNFDEFIKVVESRRTVRVFTSEVIPDEIVDRVIDLGLLAPNSSNLQPWEFYWVKDSAKKSQLAEYCMGQSAARTAPTLIVCVARTKTWRKHCQQMLTELRKQGDIPKVVETYYSKLSPFIYSQGPLGIWGCLKKPIFAVLGLFRVVPRGPFGIKELQAWAHKTTALACENMMLGFRAAGYDTCPMEGFDEVRVRKLLQLPCDARVTMVIAAGRRADGGVYSPRLRFSKSQFVFKV